MQVFFKFFKIECRTEKLGDKFKNVIITVSFVFIIVLLFVIENNICLQQNLKNRNYGNRMVLK